MTKATLEERVATLERQVAEMQTALENGAWTTDWRRTVGMFTGNEIMREIDELALEYREADRRKARGRQRKARRPKP